MSVCHLYAQFATRIRTKVRILTSWNICLTDAWKPHGLRRQAFCYASDPTDRERVCIAVSNSKNAQYVFGAHDEMLSLAVRVNNPDPHPQGPQLRPSLNSIRLC